VSFLFVFLCFQGFCAPAPAQQTSKSGIDFEPNVPLLFIDYPGRLDYGQKVRAKLRLGFPKASGPQTNDLAGPFPCEVKFHGAVSMGFAKKSLGLELDVAEPLLGMQKRTHWVLNAAYIDRSLMRHKLSYDLYRSLGTAENPRFAPSSRFVEVIVNGEYRGAYLLMEQVDRKLLGFRNYSKGDAGHACIYKAVEHAARFDQNGHDGYEQREPNPGTAGDYWKPIEEVNRFANSSRDAAFFDPKNGIASRLDLGSAIDFHLLQLVTCNADSPTKNFIIARDAPRQGKDPLFFFVPWDFDATFGRDWNAHHVSPQRWLSNYLYDRLLSNAEYRARYVRRWKELRQKQLSEASIVAIIDENARVLGEAAHRNAKRWPTTRGNYPDSLSFEEDLAQMKQFVSARLRWLDGKIAEYER
jgi:spore coat protein CotH